MIRLKTLLFTLLILLTINHLEGISELGAQPVPASLEGRVFDQKTAESLPGANIALLNPADSTLIRGTTTAADGTFSFPRIRPTIFLMSVSFVGYHRQFQEIDLREGSVTGLEIGLIEDSIELADVRVTAVAERMEVRGDTIAFNADAYKVNPDATAEELVRRMPGISVENGRVQSQGEDVRRVLVDGAEFFGDDATAALRNLPAEIIQQVEVFDRMNDQSRFTGVNDGNTELTLNIRTRPGMNHGRFGRGTSSYGTENRYMTGGNMNFFNGPQRLSLIGLTNNMNQQNFASEDLAGVAQAPARGGRGGGMRGGGRGGWGGGGAARDFLTGQQNGVSSVHSFGVNYTDRWTESWNVSGSYFFNASDNTNNQSLERRFVSGFQADQLYDEASLSTSENFNHRFNARMEYTLDERNSFIFTPRMSFQTNDQSQFLNGATMAENLALINQTSNDFRSDTFNYDMSSSLLYRRSFEKRGRTFSVNLQSGLNDRLGDERLIGESLFYDEVDRNDVFNQTTDIQNGGYNLSADFQYTEPLTQTSQLIFGYNPGFNRSTSQRDVLGFNEETGVYDVPDMTLTNRFENNVVTHRASGGYRIGNQKYNANINLSYLHTSLNGEQVVPFDVETQKIYNNLLPRAMFMYNFSRSSNLRLFYNTNTRTPTANQLQNVIDNSNPLQLSAGNPDLDQQYSHNMSLRFRRANSEKGTAFMSFVSVNYTTEYIGNTTFVAQRDTLIADGIEMGRGARLTRPENTGNAWNIRSFMNYTLPVGFIKSNMNIFSGVTYSQTPVQVNSETADSRNIGLNSGFSLSSNISPQVDFSISYRAAYNIVDNSLNPELDNNYYSGRARFNINLLPWNRLVIATELNATHYEGLPDDFNADTWFWNASLGYKFLKNNAAEVRMTVVDILAQNNSVNRVIEDNYVEDIRSNVLSRYMMFSFTYNFRAFSGGRG